MQQESPLNYVPTTQMTPPTDSIGMQPLRAAPIEDLPFDRATSGSSANDGVRRGDGSVRTNYGQYNGNSAPNMQAAQTTPLASISTLRTTTTPAPVVAKTTMQMPVAPPTEPEEKPDIQKQTTAYMASLAQQEEPTAQETDQETYVAFNDRLKNEMPTDEFAATKQKTADDEENTSTASEQQEQVPVEQDILANRKLSPNNAMLLDIVQSLPLMPSPPQSQAVSGRTMRALGSVLLEGHLVPQSRLEVAQNIQRMLRGVDLNYQLGEILLMFKLLTPDQLLAASLVSYGMISTQQISALGRIRQELHAVGLEYDLESLLILFRMITPEQLREVRTGWQG